MDKVTVRIAASVVALALVLTLLFGSFEIISPSERAVRVTMGTVSNQVYGPGFQWKWPIFSHFETYNLKPTTDEMIIEVGPQGAISSDNQTIGVGSTFFWTYDPNRIMEIVKNYPDTSQLSKLIGNTVYEALKAEIGKYTIFQLAQSAGKIANDAKAAAIVKLKPYPVVLTQFNLTNWDWSDDFDAQIKVTVAEQQKVELARASATREEQKQRERVIVAEATARATVAEAQGIKDAALLKADAKRAEGQGIADYNKSVAQNLEMELKFRQLEIDRIRAPRWNGQEVPNYLPIAANGTIIELPAKP